MADLLSLDGRIVVVSGAGGGGIGTTVTRMAAEAGATVVAVSRSKENLDEHIAPLGAQGLSVVPVAADASTDDGIAAVIDQVRGHRRRSLRIGQCRRWRRAVDLDAVDPGDSQTTGVHCSPRTSRPHSS